MSEPVKILFCDFDGVLNSTDYMKSLNGSFNDVPKYQQLDPQAVARLNQITDATGVLIVISSTWRQLYKRMTDLRSVCIKAGITGKIIDRTPVNNNKRGLQIEEWLSKFRRPVEKFIILDDDSDMGNLKNHLVKTSFQDGLQDHHVEIVIDFLK